MPYDLFDAQRRYKILQRDAGLAPYSHEIVRRMQCFENALAGITKEHGSLPAFANAQGYFGFHQCEGEWVYREWAPAAKAVALLGDFTGWKKGALPLTRLADGVWELRRPGKLPHGSRVRIRIRAGGESLERIPLYIRRAVQNPDTLSFDGQVWAPEMPYQWRHGGISAKAPLRVYECHVGMAGEEERVATFAEFTRDVLPRVAGAGYNAIQIMGVMEHPYYASYGYQVSSFFAVSSRFGTPEEFKALVDEAHRLDIAVILDLVHSHAAKNEVEGIGRFDGTHTQFFHEGERGVHPDWNSRLFHYGKPGVLRFLLSNLRFWLEEYRLDGFRFDGVTSMLYHDHGRRPFTGYADYFGPATDLDAAVYLMLATELCRAVKPGCLLLAEDMSGMPGMALPVDEGGFGFGYRLAMGVPEYWAQTLKQPDEDWSMTQMWHVLASRRPGEKAVGYCECHDQAMVGEKTLMFRMAGSAVYNGMQTGSASPTIERAVALHKMIRLATFALAGEGYLSFMGNEFGHPEWIDFPREGNGNSYRYARRQWSLADDTRLRYGGLARFDKAMLALDETGVTRECSPQLMVCDDWYKLLFFRVGKLLFCFNFHFAVSAAPPAIAAGKTPLLYTGAPEFGGRQVWPGGTLPRRTAAVFAI